MSVNYGFEFENNEFDSSLKLINLGTILLISSWVIAFIIGIFYLIGNFAGDDVINILIWILDIILLVVIMGAIGLSYHGFAIFHKSIGKSEEKQFKRTRIILLVFGSIFIPFTIGTLIFHITNYLPTLIFSKNLLMVFFVTGYLLSLSLNLNELKQLNYKTNLLFTPLVMLAVPSVVGLVFGVIGVIFPYEHFNSWDSSGLAALILYFYLTLSVVGAFVEFHFMLKQLTTTERVQEIESVFEEKTVAKPKA